MDEYRTPSPHRIVYEDSDTNSDYDSIPDLTHSLETTEICSPYDDIDIYSYQNENAPVTLRSYDDFDPLEDDIFNDDILESWGKDFEKLLKEEHEKEQKDIRINIVKKVDREINETKVNELIALLIMKNKELYEAGKDAATDELRMYGSARLKPEASFKRQAPKKYNRYFKGG